MRRFFSVAAALAFTAWILPLGAFIGASQEKTACHGKRAFHMCALAGAAAAEKSADVSFQMAGEPGKGPAAPGASADDLLIRGQQIIFSNSAASFREMLLSIPRTPSLYRLDAVPKA